MVARSAVAAALGTAAALALSSPLPFHPRAILLGAIATPLVARPPR